MLSAEPWLKDAASVRNHVSHKRREASAVKRTIISGLEARLLPSFEAETKFYLRDGAFAEVAHSATRARLYRRSVRQTCGGEQREDRESKGGEGTHED